LPVRGVGGVGAADVDDEPAVGCQGRGGRLRLCACRRADAGEGEHDGGPMDERAAPRQSLGEGRGGRGRG
jgi:hypothetical protein